MANVTSSATRQLTSEILTANVPSSRDSRIWVLRLFWAAVILSTRVSKQAIQHFLDRRKESNRFYPVSSEKSRVPFRPSCSLKRSRQKRTNCLVYKSNGETFLNTHPCYHIAMGPKVLFPTLSSILWATTLSSTVVLGVIVTVLLFAFILIGNNDHYHLHYHTTTTIPPLPPLPHLFDWVTYFLFVFFLIRD